MKKPALIPFWFSIRVVRYGEVHFGIKVKLGDATIIVDKVNGTSRESTLYTPRKYLSDKEIIDKMIECDGLRTNELGTDRSSAYRRLEKMRKEYPQIKRKGTNPALYYYDDKHVLA